MKVAVFLLTMMFALFSCKKQQALDKNALIAFVQNPENGLVKKIDKGNFLLELDYKPKEILWYSELLNDSNNSFKTQIGSLDYFVLKISKRNEDPTNSLAGSDSYVMAQRYLSSSIASDIKLISAQGTLQPIEFNFSPTYGTTNDVSVLLTFDSNLHMEQRDFKILFDDNFFGTGLSSFSFQIDDIKEIPQLKLQ
jgi:hypothetical protein